jgi:hypothetical protein
MDMHISLHVDLSKLSTVRDTTVTIIMGGKVKKQVLVTAIENRKRSWYKMDKHSSNLFSLSCGLITSQICGSQETGSKIKVQKALQQATVPQTNRPYIKCMLALASNHFRKYRSILI